MSVKLVVVGGGKMGGALVGGLISSGWAKADELSVVETVEARRDELALEYPGLLVIDIPEVGMLEESGDQLAGAVLAVKPDVAEGVCRVLGAVGITRVLSIVAGIPSGRLETALGGQPSVVRAMPNTPALVGAGMTAISGGSYAT
jgi:pyrroline-5-carboxylate reductase